MIPKTLPDLLRASSLKHVLKIFRIDDSPQRVALGFGLGVFTGIFPGIGPIAAVFLAVFLRVNRVSAVLGSLAVNTWLSFLIIIPAAKAGALLFGIKWQDLTVEASGLLSKFNWLALFKLSALKVALPVLAGYAAISFCLGIAAYLISLAVIIMGRRSL